MIDLECPVGASIETEGQARHWVLDLIVNLERLRGQIDLIPGQLDQKRGYDNFRIHLGQALGVVVALQRCHKLNDVAYNELSRRILQTSMPTVTLFQEE